MAALVGAAMTAGGAALALETWPHTSPGLGLSRAVGYLPLPISGALIVAFALEHMVATVRGEEVAPSWS